MATCWLHCLSLRAPQCRVVFPELPVPLVGRESPGGITSSHPQHCGSLCGSSYSDLTPEGMQGNLWGSTSGNLTVRRRREGLAIISTWILADRVHTFRAQAIIPSINFVHHQNTSGVHSDQRTQQGIDLPVSDPQIRSFVGPKAQFAHTQAKS